MLGEALWNGTTVALEYTHADRKPLEQSVSSAVSSRSGPPIPFRGCRRNPFPKDDDEALAR